MSNDVVYWLQERALRRYGATMNAAHTETQEWLWADEITRLREENARLREALIDTLASLVASVDLLECGGKKAAPSDKMFEQMLVDYKNTIERGRYAAAIREGGKDDAP